MEAVCGGSTIIVQLLLDAGADVTKEDETGRSALDMAREMDDGQAMMKLIEEFLESTERPDGDGESRI